MSDNGIDVALNKARQGQGNAIGASFQALAEGSAAKVDAELQRIIPVDRILAQQAEDDSKVRTAFLGNQRRGKNSSVVQFNWPPIVETEPVIDALEASWVTGHEEGADGAKSATFSNENAVV